MGKNINYSEMVDIIQAESAIADESLAQFFIRCCEDAGDDFYDMIKVLYENIIPDIGGLAEVLNIVTNDERYFKWDKLDEFNREGGFLTPINNIGHFGGGDHSKLAAIYAALIYRDGVKEVVPDVDFITGMSGSLCKSWGVKFLPCVQGLYQYADSGKFPKDMYTGVLVSRSVYPDASSSALSHPHRVIVFTERKPLGDSQIHHRCDMPEYVIRDDLLKYDDPGLIWVPIKNKLYNAIKAVAPNSWKPQLIYSTCLPKHILDKYGLPTMEI